MKRGTGWLRLAAVLCVALAGGAGAAENYTWTGSLSSDWFDSGNWSGGSAVPGDGAGDTATISSGSVLLTNSPANPLASFVITNATLTFTNWTTALNATEVTVRNAGKLTHMSCRYVAPASSNRVYVVASNVTVEVGGSIDAYAAGYTDGGPGSSTSGRNGGCYGGLGGGRTSGIYGSADMPSDPGSRGYSENTKGAGGGVVRIAATGRVTVNGTIKADGQLNGGATIDYSGYGSGGSVYITCNTFGGTNGSVTARGGYRNPPPGDYVGGGGGGRIAVAYSPTAQQSEPRPTVTFDAKCGASAFYTPGTMGTVFFSDGQLVPEAIVNSSGYFWLWGTTNAVTVSNLNLNASSIAFGSAAWQASSTDLVVNVNGSLTLTNTSSLSLYSGLTNNPAVTNCGLFINVSSNVDLAANCWIYAYSHPTNGATPYFKLENLTIATNAGFNANAKGYITGYGLGRGKASRTGGGYGGRGQNYSLSNGGDSYGSDTVPVDSGSPGISENTKGTGGGAVRIEARNAVVVNGLITANGQDVSSWSGAGSGGSIYISCIGLSGGLGSSIIARGGNGDVGAGVVGGGGRIALWRVQQNFLGTISATNGSGGAPASYPVLAQTGTVVLVDVDMPGTYKLTVAGDPIVHGTPTPPYGVTPIAWNSWSTNTVNSPADSAGGTRYACTGWTLTSAAGPVDSGSTTQAVFQMSTNLWLTWNWTNEYYLAAAAAANGALAAEKTGWYTNGTVVGLQAVPDTGSHFLQWTGNLPTNQYYGASASLTMDRPQNALAHFASDTPQNKTWSGAGDWFANYTNWDPDGAPGAADAVTIASGTPALGYAVQVQALTVSGNSSLSVTSGIVRTTLTVTDGFLLSGASAQTVLNNADLTCGSLMLTNGAAMSLYSGAADPATNAGQVVRVMGELRIANNSWVYPYSHTTIGASPFFRVGSLRIDGPSGGVNADAKGFVKNYGPGRALIGRTGGGYGGRGQGYSVTRGGGTYGSSNAPVEPGSPGLSENTSGTGGGLVRIEADGQVVVNGTITADGQACGGYSAAGSGGGIYIVCRSFSGNASGMLSARGGNAAATGGADGKAGGGGRIAVWRSSGVFENAPVATKGTGGDPNSLPLATDGTVVWGVIPPSGTVVLLR